ncbi:hypothetical protein JB92DRAFT_1219741 [Gautieria morchelliformis]|nr:hypothetical protein JB92DRAFT_1219741 [Gautieria morchelliformis]
MFRLLRYNARRHNADHNTAFSEAVETLPSESKSFLLATNLDITFTPTHVGREVHEYCNKQLSQSRLYQHTQTFIETAIDPLETMDQRVPGNLVLGIASCLRFVVTLVCPFARHFENITHVLENIAGELHFYHTCVIFYPNAPRLREAMVKMYSDIFTVCITVMRVFKNQKGADRSKFMIYFRALNPCDIALHKVVTQFDIRHAELKREIQLAREQTAQRWALEHKRDGLLLPGGMVADYDLVHASCRALIASDASGRWLLLRPEYTVWKSNTWDKDTASLWITGNAGAGKTILVSTVIEDLRGMRSSKTAVACFYCQQKKHDGRVLLGTLLYQLTNQIPFLSPHFPTFDSSINEIPVLKASIITLQQMVFESIYLVVDALDELDIVTGTNAASDQYGVLSILKELAGIPGLRVLATGREKDNIKAVLGPPSITITEDDISDEINSYIKDRVRLLQPHISSSAHHPLYHHTPHPWPCVFVKSPELQDDIIKALMEGAHGIFRWVHLQVLDFSNGQTVNDMTERIKRLKNGLDMIYN